VVEAWRLDRVSMIGQGGANRETKLAAMRAGQFKGGDA
jgi:hypothetical protein